MKIKILPVEKAPNFYEFDGEVIAAIYDEVSETYDLSGIPEGATLTSADPVNGVTSIRGATRVDGELHVSLCQQTGPGHWVSSEEFDASEYDPYTVYAVLNTERSYAGRAWAKTRKGNQYVDGSE